MGNNHLLKVATLTVMISLISAGCNKDDLEEISSIEHITVATMNVDGLPLSVNLGNLVYYLKDIVPSEHFDGTTLLINPDGPGIEGSIQIGQKIQSKGWDIFGFNEDFNFHSQIWSALGGYSEGTYSGAIDSINLLGLFSKFMLNEFLFDSDGLEFGVKKAYSVEKEVICPWNSDALYGYVTNCNDRLTTKGFRYYQVLLDKKTGIDFIILHADAGGFSEDRQARENGLKQLYDFITLNVTTKNPLVIMGDFNCLYARDRLKELFIDSLNANSEFEVCDVWVQYCNGGVYPEYMEQYPVDSILHINKTSEMLDKIIYLNRKDSPIRLRLDSTVNVFDFTRVNGKQLSDHYPLQASFYIER